MTKIKAEINKIETRNTIEMIKLRAVSSKRNNVDISLGGLKKKKENIQIKKIRNERGEITTDNIKY